MPDTPVGLPLPAQVIYEPTTDQLVIRVPAAEGQGDVELLRLDVRQFTAADKARLAAVRDPKQAQPAPGAQPVTRR